jgi:hypothetical protein
MGRSAAPAKLQNNTIAGAVLCSPTRDRWEPSVIATSRLIARMKVMNRHTLLALLLIAALATAYPSRNPSHIPTTSVRNRSVISL